MIVALALALTGKMALTTESPVYLHLIQNVSLILLAIVFAPLCTFIAFASSFTSPHIASGKIIQDHRKCQQSSPTLRPRIVLVTGVGMAKGLAIARAFYREGHTVFGADFEPSNIPVSGRFSKSLKKFYRLPKSSPNDSTAYVNALIDIIKKEHVDLWVSCSGVASAVEDGHAADSVERLTSCVAIQFSASLTETLHGKHSFIESIRQFGLNSPITQLITSTDDAVNFLYQRADENASRKQYIMKSVGLDDSIRADMTLLPRGFPEQTRNHVSHLRPSVSNPFVLQQFISGPEYCTHSIVIRGKVRAFTACKSAGILMHYKSLPPESSLFQTMLEYTQMYAEKTGREMTGHFSIDFLVDESNSGIPLMERMFPIECNPRAHTAVTLFADDSKGMVEAYLSSLGDKEGMEEKASICTPLNSRSYFWVGHDLVEYVILPVWEFLNLRIRGETMVKMWMTFLEHLLTWKEGTFAVWDPWPAWWLYCVYWPSTFMVTIWTRSWWSKCNVSTNKVFRC